MNIAAQSTSGEISLGERMLDRDVRAGLAQRSIVLIGMMGAGKSAVGRRLAGRLDMGFVDADEEIVKAADRMPIPEIFEKFGEAYFRRAEAGVIGRILKSGQQVLATGGGAFMNAETRSIIRDRSVSIWLKAELPVLLERITRKGVATRPMLQNGDPSEKLRRLMAARHPVYAEADLTILSLRVRHKEMVDKVLAELSLFLNS